MLSILIVVLIFIGLAFFGWRLARVSARETRETFHAWLKDVVVPYLRPAITRPIHKLQHYCVVAVLASVIVTGAGRGALRSPVKLYLSPDDFDSVEPVQNLFVEEVEDELFQAATKKGWDVDRDLFVELQADPAVRDGWPEAENGAMGRTTRPERSFRRRGGPAEERTEIWGVHRDGTKTVIFGAEGARSDPDGDTRPYVVEELVSLDGAPTIEVPPAALVLTLGRDGCDIALVGEGVSRHHATLRRDGCLLMLVDQGSTNGLYVNGDRIQRCELVNGDEVRFGVAGPRYVFSRLAKVRAERS